MNPSPVHKSNHFSYKSDVSCSSSESFLVVKESILENTDDEYEDVLIYTGALSNSETVFRETIQESSRSFRMRLLQSHSLLKSGQPNYWLSYNYFGAGVEYGRNGRLNKQAE